MQTPVALSAPDAEVIDLPVDQSPFLDQTVDPGDVEDPRQYVDEASPVPISVPLMNIAARGVGAAGEPTVKRQLGFYREAGKLMRNLSGIEGPYGSMKTSADESAHEMLIKILDDEQCNPVALAAQLDVVTSKEWRDWLPEVLMDFTQTTEGDVASRDKLLATQVAVTNEDVFSSWQLFTAVSSAFNHRRSNFGVLDKPTYIEAAWTAFCLRQIRPGVEFNAGVIRFLIALMLEDGLCFFPWTGGPGLALGVNDDGISAGLTDVSELASKVKAIWETGELHGVEPGEHDASDPFHVQLAKIVSAEAYIKAQHSSKPSEYRLENENA